MYEDDDYTPDPESMSFLFEDDSILTLSDNYPTIEYPKHKVGRYIADDVSKLMIVRGWSDAKTKEYIYKTYHITPTV